MEQPILEGLIAYQKAGYYPWHMPGHKRKLNTIFPELVTNPFSIDVTEVGDLDEFHNPEGIIRQAFDRAADVYGSHKSYYLVNGSTCGLLAAISAICKRGESIIVARNSHTAVYDALRLLQIHPIYIMPEWNKELCMYGGISAETLKKIIKHNPEAKGVLIVSPTYEGVVSDVERLSKIAHKNGIPLIVDAAHGAHFEFMYNVNETLSTTNYKKLPEPAIRKGADLVIESMHKTLPAMTQCAILHENSRFVQRERIEEFLSIYQSTSPSYVFMATMESCIEKMHHERDGLFILYKERLAEYRKKLEQLKHIHLVKEEDFKKEFVAGYDVGKIVLSVRDCAMVQGEEIIPFTGKMLGDILAEEYGQMMEMAGGSYVIAMTSIADSSEAFEALLQALQIIDSQLINYENLSDNILYHILPNSCMEIDRAKDSNYEQVKIETAVGRISQNYIYAYPPGVPIIVPGEVFTKEIINQIMKMMDCKLNVKGICIKEKNQMEKDDKGMQEKQVYVSVTTTVKQKQHRFMSRRKKNRDVL